MITQIQIYLLNDEQTSKIIEINNETKNYAIICNYGLGDCISAEIDSLDGFEQHTSYIQSQGIEITEIEVEDDD
jgi:hypothetical protein